MGSEARPNGASSDQCVIPNLQDVTLEELAQRAADGDREVTAVVSRIRESKESPSGVPAMMFNSAI